MAENERLERFLLHRTSCLCHLMSQTRLSLRTAGRDHVDLDFFNQLFHLGATLDVSPDGEKLGTCVTEIRVAIVGVVRTTYSSPIDVSVYIYVVCVSLSFVQDITDRRHLQSVALLHRLKA